MFEGLQATPIIHWKISVGINFGVFFLVQMPLLVIDVWIYSNRNQVNDFSFTFYPEKQICKLGSSDLKLSLRYCIPNWLCLARQMNQTTNYFLMSITFCFCSWKIKHSNGWGNFQPTNHIVAEKFGFGLGKKY